MFQKRLILISCALAILMGCPSQKVPDAPKDWAYGTWVAEKVSTDVISKQAMENKGPVEKHAMVFDPNGQITRVAKNNKTMKLMMEFQMTGPLLELRPPGQEKYAPYGELLPDGMMKMYISQDSYFIYRKLAQPLTEKDLDGTPAPDTP